MRFRNFLILFLMIFTFAAQAYVVSAQNPTEFNSVSGSVADILIAEEWPGELANTTITIRLKNTALWYTLTTENVWTTSYARNSAQFPSILGIIGTNTLKLNLPETTLSGGVAVVKIVNIWVNTQFESGDYDVLADVSAVIQGDIVTYPDIDLGHKFVTDVTTTIPLDKKYMAYFTNDAAWWSAAVLINDTDTNKDITVTFVLTASTLTRTYSVSSHSQKILDFFNDSALSGQTGYLKVYLPPGTDFMTLCGDGTQLFSR